jgi:hypothetical protein
MKFSIAILALAAVATLQSCSRTESPKASDAIMSAYNAVNNKDTAAYLATLTASARQLYQYNPKALAADLAYWSANHFDVQVMSETGDADEAVVSFRVNVTGKYPEQTTPSMLVTKENGQWKITVTSFYSADRIPLPPQEPGSNEKC